MPWYRIPARIAERVTDDPVLKELMADAEEAHGHEHAGGVVHINFGRAGNKKAPAPCSVCGWISERLCDWIINDSILIHGKPKTCDKPLCTHCSVTPAPGKDLCPSHIGPLKAWLAGRTNSCDGEGP